MNAPRLEFRYLGQFAIRAGAEWQPGPSPKKGRDLIQFLGAYPRRVGTRDELASAFWPELDADSIAHRVHLAVSGARTYLRAMLGGHDAIQRVAGGYAWDPRVTVSSDVDGFLALCRAGSLDELRSAVASYRGEFLAGELADWMQPLHIRCATAYEFALELLAQDAQRNGDAANAVSYGLELVAAEPGHEGATRLVMRAFAAQGQRGRALERYDALQAYLRKHLGLAPTEETASLARALLAGAELERESVTIAH